MTTTNESLPKASKLKDLVVTATVASLVSALVAPWIRRWMDGPTVLGPHALPPATEGPPDDFDAKFDRLLTIPNPFEQPRTAVTSERTLHDDEDYDDEH